MTELPKSARIYVAGHRGLVGSAILRVLEKEGYTNLLMATREQLDLRDQAAVNYWFKQRSDSELEVRDKPNRGDFNEYSDSQCK